MADARRATAGFLFKARLSFTAEAQRRGEKMIFTISLRLCGEFRSSP
jgi:hypothetical protein